MSGPRAPGCSTRRTLSAVFALLRPNELVFNYVVNNYLLGKPPARFDILAWNADGTNLPAQLHRQFLDIYQHNLLTEPGALEVLGTPVDLGRIEIETYVTGATTDHLTPWKGCYRTTQLLSGPSTFILSNAGPHRQPREPARQPEGPLLRRTRAGRRSRRLARRRRTASRGRGGPTGRHGSASARAASARPPDASGAGGTACSVTPPGRMSTDSAGDLLWAPAEDDDPDSGIARYLAWLRDDRGLAFDGYAAFWAWSVDRLEDFWQTVWDFYGVDSETPPGPALAVREMPGARWFPGARVNYAEHVLRCADR